MDVPPKIKENPYKDKIDEMLTNGHMIKEVVAFLEEVGHPVSRNLLGKYKNNCLDVNAEAVDLYIQKQAMKDAAEKQVSTLEFYDKLINAGTSVNPNMINDDKVVDLALKAAKQKEDFLREHGDKEAEIHTQLLKEIRDELLQMNLMDVIRGISNDRTAKRRTSEEDNS